MIGKKKYRTILIDDEPLALQRLEKLLTPFIEDVEIVAKATNGADAIEVIDELKPDVIFLDIQMPELNGFEVLEKIKHQYDQLTPAQKAIAGYILHNPEIPFPMPADQYRI